MPSLHARQRAPHLILPPPPLVAQGMGALILQREMSTSMVSSKAMSKMGSLSVDKMAGSSAVQSVEYVLTGFDKLVNWARKSSMWPMTFGLA